MTEKTCGCPTYLTTRRRLLATAAAGTTTALVGDVLTQSVYGAGRGGNVLLVLSLRGGADGLSLLVPHAEKAYYSARPTTAIAQDRLLHADATFGLHPAFAPLTPLWNQGRMTALHAVGLPVPNRSHFDAMEEIEDADPGSAARIGWLNRFVGGLGASSVLEGVQIGSNVLPTSLVGPQPTVALATPDALTLPFSTGDRADQLARALRDMHAGGGQVARAGREGLALSRAGGRYSKAAVEPAKYDAAYPGSALGASLRRAAALVRADVGARAIAVDHGSWDHHVDVGGNVNAMVGDLAGSLAAFFTDLGPDARRVTVVTLSEFGRRLAQNGSSGVDHGYGNAVLVLGAGVRGGRFHGRWPGLSEGRQVEGDLAVTTDYRHVLGTILRHRFPEVALSRVFPGLPQRDLGFMR